MFMIFFFFTSRRRHTRFDCDWSSDVCSSDLGGDREGVALPRVVVDQTERRGESFAIELDRRVASARVRAGERLQRDRKSTRLNSSHSQISYAVFCLKKKKTERHAPLERARRC